MFAWVFQDYRLPAAGFGLLAAAILTFTAIANGSEPRERLQQIADQAALAGAAALGVSTAADDQGRREDAIEATKTVLAGLPAAEREVTASAGDLTVTVKLAAADARSSSTARYTPPDQAADWAWAARQRFALESRPVVLGSNCGRDCDNLR
jgi:Flp pilus assembly protein TadG